MDVISDSHNHNVIKVPSNNYALLMSKDMDLDYYEGYQKVLEITQK